jgi:hypothetical protein
LRDGHTGRYYHGAGQGDEITPSHEHLRNDHTVTILAGYRIGRREITRGRKCIRKIRDFQNGSTRHFYGARATSGLPRKTDMPSGCGDVSNVPILLQNSFWGVERKFLEPLMRFARGDVRDHIG